MTAVRAAVVRAAGEAPRVETIDLRDPGPGQVRVRLAATGVCHSDLSLANGTMVQPFPAVLGHEGAGRVVACGDGVNLREGDAVVLNWSPSCRECWFCVRGEPYLCARSTEAASQPYARLEDGAEVYPGLGVAAFATETVVNENACVRIGDDVPLEQAAVLGCAMLTGVGAVLNAAHAAPGESVVVVGLGGVGLCAVQGARIAGAGPVIAVDPSPDKGVLARKLGATDVLQPSAELSKQVRALTGGRGADNAIECVGRGDTIRAAWSTTRRGGHTIILGMGARTDTVSFNALEIAHFARTLQGCMFGASDPERDLPMLLEHVRAGRLDVDTLVTARIGLDAVDVAFADLEAGRGARSLIVFED